MLPRLKWLRASRRRSDFLVFTDDFTRSNQTPIAAPNGGTYLFPFGSGSNKVNLVSDQSVGQASDENIALLSVPSFLALTDQSSELTYVGGGFTRIWCRLQNTGPAGYMVTTNTSGNQLEIYIVSSGGSYTKIANTAYTAAANDKIRLAVTTAAHPFLEAFVNNVSKLTVSDTADTFLAGYPGFGTYGNVAFGSWWQAKQLA